MNHLHTFQKSRYLFSFSKDFLFLGGGSLLILIIIRSILQNNSNDLAISFEITLLLANIINHPHFAISYLIFYSDFRKKISSPCNKGLRFQYVFIGVVFPIFLIFLMVFFIKEKDAVTLGIAANLMFFLVGWHYVKQGYGMLMLDAALKKYFFSLNEKKIFLRNAYAIWLLAWVMVNYISQNNQPNYFGIPYQSILIPNWVMALFSAFAICTTIQCITVIFSIAQEKRNIAWNGIWAYTTSLYAWLLIRDPIIILWIPLFHSIQYLAVACKFQFEKLKFCGSHRENNYYSFYLSMAISLLLGYLFFIHIPSWMDQNINYNKEIFGHSLFMFVFWIFINIHHYLIDTVMWRKGNPDVQKYLFQ